MRRVLALVALLALAAPAAAACPRTTLGDIEDEVMCPVCGTSLSVATEAPQAERERRFIQRLIDSCRSKDQIKDTLAAQFGSEVLATPESKGFSLTAWMVPVLVILAALGLIGAAGLRWRRGGGGPAAASDSPQLDPGDAARLDRDLERYE